MVVVVVVLVCTVLDGFLAGVSFPYIFGFLAQRAFFGTLFVTSRWTGVTSHASCSSSASRFLANSLACMQADCSVMVVVLVVFESLPRRHLKAMAPGPRFCTVLDGFLTGVSFPHIFGFLARRSIFWYNIGQFNSRLHSSVVVTLVLDAQEVDIWMGSIFQEISFPFSLLQEDLQYQEAAFSILLTTF